MTPARIVLLVCIAFFLALSLVAGQVMILVQQSVLRNEFLLPHVERLLSSVAAPQTHEEIVRYALGEILSRSRVRGLDAAMQQRLMAASIEAFSAQWIRGEILGIVNAVLRVLHGNTLQLSYTIHLSRPRAVLLSEFTRGLPLEVQQEARAGVDAVPNAVDLTELTGKEFPETIRMLRQRFVLFSLLFVYLIPGAMVLLGLRVGRARWGIAALGAGVLASGVLFLALMRSLFPRMADDLLLSLLNGLPSALDWLRDYTRAVLVDVAAAGRSIAIACTAAGAVILATGVSVVLLARRKSA
jgi:hypothetical protein